MLAEGLMQAGQIEEALATLSEAMEMANDSDERHCEAELYRLRGELLLVKDVDQAESEPLFWRAIEVARQQQAKSWELRATMSLCRLWQRQGKGREAHRMLAEIYGWFTEGFDTADLMEARALLGNLSEG
jgi:predicted ATPase